MLFVLAVPKFTPSDLAVIEKFRAEFEPERAKMVPAHLTLMFGTSELNPDAALELTTKVARITSPFQVVFEESKLADDVVDNTVKLHLLVAAGRRRVTQLHDEIYSRLPAGELRADIPYVPHVTIATCNSRSDADSALRASAQIPAPIAAAVDELTLVEVNGTQVRTIARRSLAL